MTLYKDSMPEFNNEIHCYGCKQSILWSPLKNWTPKIFEIVNFEHPVSKSWLRPWLVEEYVDVCVSGMTCAVL